jgi:ACS family D-galactonate transporter-like MFS transporter
MKASSQVATVSQRSTSMRWWMLLLISLGVIELTLNWFNIAAAFPALGQQFRLQVPQLAALISLFIAGYAIFHIPAGMLAYRIGVKNTLVLGLLVESLAGIACAFAPNYGMLAALRFITGAGGSFFIGAAFALITSWFRGRELALAMGIAGGGAFALGETLGIAGWTNVVQAAGWSLALIIAGGSGVIVCALSFLFLRVPSEEAEHLAAGNFSWTAVRRVLGNRDLWLLGLCFFGVYGMGLTTAQLLATYVGMVYHVPQSIGGLISAVFVLMSIPGSIIGGYFADRASRLRPVIVAPWIVMGVVLALFSFLGLTGVWIMVIVAGAAQIAGFAAWTAAPGHYRDRVHPEDVATSEGLMLTVAGLGGFVVPVIFGIIAGSSGFTPAFLFGGIIGGVFALIGYAAREPKRVSVTAQEPVTSLEEAFEPHPHA